MNTISIPGVSPWILVLIVLWTIPWKGIALWKSARLSHKWWFVIMLVVNTVGILEIIYIFLVARKYNVETVDGSERNVPQAPDNFGAGTPDANFDEPSIPSRENSVSSSEMTSISQIIKTVETKNAVVPPKKEPKKEETKVEAREEQAEGTKSSPEK